MKTKHLVALLSAIILMGCQSKENQETACRSVKVKTMVVSTDTVSNTGNYSGTVEEDSGTMLSFAIPGTVRTLNIRLGQRVAAGQLIATLDPTSMQSSYKSAQAALTQAEDAYRRMKELYDKGSLPEIKWVELQSQVEQARSNEEIAAKNLRDCKLYAPFAGVIAEKSIEAGQNVVPGTPVAKLVTTSLLKIKISVPEAEIASICDGTVATVVVPALNGKIFKAEVIEKGIVANPISRSYDVKMRVVGTYSDLMPGMVAEVALNTRVSDTAEHVIIPAEIIQLDERNDTFVWVVKNGKACKRTIACGEYTSDGVMILSGLSGGDEIIVGGQQKVCEGTEVTLL